MEVKQEINLHIEGQVFRVKKDVLCTHSDYFRAMFSGYYIEEEQKNITINVVGANSMNIILRYMDLGSLDLSEYTVNVISHLAMASNFLQITPLVKQIQNYLDAQLTLSNCLQIMYTAEQCLYTKLEHLSTAFALLSFKSMIPQYVPTIESLFWYLSHPYLDNDNELEVFKFGFDWMSQTQTSGDALLIVLGCLDVKRLTSNDLKQISFLIKESKNSIVEKVINCLEWLCNSDGISLETVTKKRSILCETFTERAYTETYNIVKESRERMLKYSAVMHMWSEDQAFMLYKYTEEKTIRDMLMVLPENNLIGWSIAAWGSFKLVVVCGRQNHTPGSFMKDVMIYDTLRKEWTNHGVELPPRMCGKVAVVDDLLYIIGGYDIERPIEKVTIVYNLQERNYKEIPGPPGGTKNVHICNHKGSLYAARYPQQLFVYENSGQRNSWRKLLINKEMLHGRHKLKCLISFNEYIYSCSNGNFVRRIRPEIDTSCEIVSLAEENMRTVTMCSLKTQLLVFFDRRESDELMENNICYNKGSIFDLQITYLSIAGCCPLTLDLPPSLRTEASKYHQKYLLNYSHVQLKCDLNE